MKLNKLKELINANHSVDNGKSAFDFQAIVDAINEDVNETIKAKTPKNTDILAQYGFASEDAFKEAISYKDKYNSLVADNQNRELGTALNGLLDEYGIATEHAGLITKLMNKDGLFGAEGINKDELLARTKSIVESDLAPVFPNVSFETTTADDRAKQSEYNNIMEMAKKLKR